VSAATEDHGEEGPHTWIVLKDESGGRIAECRICGRQEPPEAWVEQQHIDQAR
jgi:hypothetical protein